MQTSVAVGVLLGALLARVVAQQGSARIIGGRPAWIAFAPYQLSLRLQGWHVCGAALVSTVRALTAAHCTPENEVSKNNNGSFLYSVAAGSTFGGIMGSRRWAAVRRVVRHPLAGRAVPFDFDVAVLELDRPLSRSLLVMPVCLPESGNEIPVGALAHVTGWGMTLPGTGNSEPLLLRQVDVVVMSQELCRTSYGSHRVTDSMMCAGYVWGGKDACQGDSGGPLVWNGRLYGLISWGIGCGQPNHPGVYTRISKVRSFIKQYTGL